MSITYPELLYTNFPESVDVIPNKKDLSASNLQNMKNYQNAINTNNLSLAQQIKTDNPNLVLEMIDALGINKISNGLIAVQKFFKSNVDGYIQQKQTEFDAKVNELAYIGNYNSVTIYKNKNMVTYNSGDGDKLYLCITPNANGVVGVLPININHFRLLSTQGVQGEAGLGVSYAGEWSNTQTYVNTPTKVDGVFYGGMFFACLQTNTGQPPSLTGSTQYWGRAIGSAVTVGDTGGYREITTTTNNVNFIVGTITTYNPNTDYIEVHLNGEKLVKGLDYNVATNNISITKVSGSWSGTTTNKLIFDFFIERNMINNLVFSDGASIDVGTIPLNRMVQGVQDDINKIDTLEVSIIDIQSQLANMNNYGSNYNASTNVYEVQTYKRSDGKTYLVSTLSNMDSSSRYTRDTWKVYKSDGTTLQNTVTWTLVYDNNVGFPRDKTFVISQ